MVRATPNLYFVAGTSFPPDAIAGSICFRTDKSIFYGFDGESWKPLGGLAVSEHELDPDKGSHVGTLDLEHIAEVRSVDLTDGFVLRADGNEFLSGRLDHGDLSGITSSNHHTKYSDENAQDAVGGILDDGATGEVVFTYDDQKPEISAEVQDSEIDHNSLQGVRPNSHHLKTQFMTEMKDFVSDLVQTPGGVR